MKIVNSNIKAIYFDWFNTLAQFDPPRPEMYRNAFLEFGIQLSIKDVHRGLLAGDQHYFAENAISPVRKRSYEEQCEVYTCYPRAILAEAKITATDSLPGEMIKKLMVNFKGISMVLFEDVLPVIKELKQKGFILGLVSNADKSIHVLCEKLGLKPYLDVVITSQDIGVDKPNPAIFMAALQQGKVQAAETVYVGDQYKIDVLGARGVGMKPVLIDRYDISDDVRDVPKIANLRELLQYI